MLADEAPFLTPAVVALLTAFLFVLCLLADGLKCSPAGRRHFCIGPQLVSPCPTDPSDLNCEWVHRTSRHLFKLPAVSCDVPDSPVYYAVEVMPGDAEDRQYVDASGDAPRSFASFLMQALESRYDRWKDGDVRDYGPLDFLCESCRSSERRAQRPPLFLHDNITFPYPNLTAVAIANRIRRQFGHPVPATDWWLRELKKRLPSERRVLRGKHVLREFFPSLDTYLWKAFNEARYAGELHCPNVFLHVLVIVNPSVHLEKWIPLAAEEALEGGGTGAALSPHEVANTILTKTWKDSLEAGSQSVMATLDNLLHFHPQLSRILRKWSFSFHILPFPAHTFSPLFTSAAEAAFDAQLLASLAANTTHTLRFGPQGESPTAEWWETTADVARIILSSRMAGRNESALPAWTASLCGGEGSRSGGRADTCRGTCDMYVRQSAYLPEVRRALASATQHRRQETWHLNSSLAGHWRALRDTSGFVYQNCYHYVRTSSAGGHSLSNTTDPWQTMTPPTLFADCLHLTEEGMRQLAKCVAFLSFHLDIL